MIQHLWVEKYRPRTIDEVILPDFEKEKLKEYLSSGSVPHLAFQGPPGTGKSTLARIIRNHIVKDPDDFIALNASLHGRIDTIRETILPFLKTPPIASRQKIVYFEEFDNTSLDAQLALREPIEKYSKIASFIITFNYINKVDDAILSRMQIFTVNAPPIDKAVERCCYILDQEGITYNQEDVVKVVTKTYPSLRDAIKLLQMLSVNGQLVYSEDVQSNTFEELYKALKKLFSETRSYSEDRKFVRAILRILARSYVDLPAIMDKLRKDDDIVLELRLEAAGYVNTIAKSVSQEAAFMNALWKLLQLKHQLIQQGLFDV